MELISAIAALCVIHAFFSAGGYCYMMQRMQLHRTVTRITGILDRECNDLKRQLTF
jgi:hypothetical protein